MEFYKIIPKVPKLRFISGFKLDSKYIPSIFKVYSKGYLYKTKSIPSPSFNGLRMDLVAYKQGFDNTPWFISLQ
jgi:hypothetical protein